MNVMSIGISFIEILAILLIYNILINNNVFKEISRIGILSIITSFIYSLFTIVYDTDTLIILIGVLFLNSIVISKFEEKDTIVTFIELVVSTLLVLGFELIISFIVYVTMGDDNLSPTVYLILVTCIMSILIYLLNTNKFIKNIKFSNLFSKYKSINIIILNLFVFFLFIKVLMGNKLMNTKIIIPITIVGLILIGVNCYFYI